MTNRDRMLPADAGIGSNDPEAFSRTESDNVPLVRFARDHQLPVPDEPLFDTSGNLTPAGEELAIKNGFKVESRGGRGLTGNLKE